MRYDQGSITEDRLYDSVTGNNIDDQKIETKYILIAFIEHSIILMTEIVLNVGGTTFQSFKSTLIKSEYFRRMFEFDKNHTIPIFIDCDPEGFKHILEYLRFANYQIPKNFKYLATYFMIDDNAFVSDAECEPDDVEKARDYFRTRAEAIGTMGNAIKKIEEIISSDLHDLTKSHKVFKILYRIITHGYVRDLIWKFGRRTLIFAKEMIPEAYVSKNIHNDDRLDKYEMVNLYKVCKRRNMDSKMQEYVIDFIKLFKTDVNWVAIKNFKCTICND